MTALLSESDLRKRRRSGDVSNQPPTKMLQCEEMVGKKLTPHLGGALDRRLSLVFLACRI